MYWKIRNRRIALSRTILMGIVNITPDSFSDGKKYFDPEKAVSHALQLAEDGAAVIDLGAESTRPGAKPVSEEEELNRLRPVVEGIRSKSDIPLSIDTTKALVAARMLEAGADIINDVSGLKDSGPEMAAVVRDAHAGIVLMHRRGTPETMASLANYGNVVSDVIAELRQSLQLAIQSGIDAECIVIDPGLGFAKTAEQNLELLRGLECFHELGYPVLLGPSRKSFIGGITGRSAGQREFGTAAVVTDAVLKGIQIIRVHEAGPMKDVVLMAQALRQTRHAGLSAGA